MKRLRAKILADDESKDWNSAIWITAFALTPFPGQEERTHQPARLLLGQSQVSTSRALGNRNVIPAHISDGRCETHEWDES